MGTVAMRHGGGVCGGPLALNKEYLLKNCPSSSTSVNLKPIPNFCDDTQFKYPHCRFKERGGGQNFSTSFCMRFRQAPLCRYRFKVIFDDIIFLLSGNIIEYICFWRFNSIIMTWNKWLVFTKSVIMGLNNISPWPCPLGFVCLPCVITWLYSTPFPSCEPLV